MTTNTAEVRVNLRGASAKATTNTAEVRVKREGVHGPRSEVYLGQEVA
jgi:hypothetical protein